VVTLLISEIDYLKEYGFNCDNLRLSNRDHLILPYHMKIDVAKYITKKLSEEKGKNFYDLITC
jgi:adenylosuccinate synthase